MNKVKVEIMHKYPILITVCQGIEVLYIDKEPEPILLEFLIP